MTPFITIPDSKLRRAAVKKIPEIWFVLDKEVTPGTMIIVGEETLSPTIRNGVMFLSPDMDLLKEIFEELKLFFITLTEYGSDFKEASKELSQVIASFIDRYNEKYFKK
jgi:hypothetical protein